MYVITSSTFYFDSTYFKDKKMDLFSAEKQDKRFWFYQFNILTHKQLIYPNKDIYYVTQLIIQIIYCLLQVISLNQLYKVSIMN